MTPKSFTKPLIEWYQLNKRDLPFRKSSDPYKIWISEIMAQQTQIKTMIPYYEAWVSQWPTIASLANASDEQVKKAWEGLGYYRRASNLLKGAQYLVSEHDGCFPNSPEAIQKIPGIGDYTTGAISSIAFGLPVPAIDGNVIRVMSRLSEDDRDFLKAANKKELTATLYDLMKDVDASDFTQALMELGALVCTPKNPKCESCPLQSICKANKHDTTTMYPPVIKKAKTKTIDVVTYLVMTNSHLLVDLHPTDTLMEGLIRLPQLAKKEAPTQNYSLLYSTKHVFSHLVWKMDVMSGLDNPDLSKFEWIKLTDIENYSWVGAHRKIIDQEVIKNLST